MLEKNLDNSYFITYTNHFVVGNKTYAFRKKMLFDITSIPKFLELKNNNNCFGYWINRNWYSLSKIKNLIINEPIKVDVSDIQWYNQINLDQVFNLKP